MGPLAKFITIVSYGFFQAWMLMVGLGMLAGYLAIPGLAIGYWATWGLSTLLSIGFSGEVGREINKQ